MLASSFSFEAGTRLRAKRERLHLSIRRVAQMSQKIAQEKNDPAFFVPHNWISDLENGKSKTATTTQVSQSQPHLRL